MSDRHFAHWPQRIPRHMTVPECSLNFNVEVAATKYPNKPYIVFYDTTISFAEFRTETERLAGYLQQDCGVKKGDRVLLYMQNSPQFALAYYAILRADAVVVPVNPMNRSAELRHNAADSGARVVFVAQELFDRVEPLLGVDGREGRLDRVIVAAYSDYLKADTDLAVPDFVRAPRMTFAQPGVSLWTEALAAGRQPAPSAAGPDDLAVMPYTSGTTGHPKGCMHTHRSVMYNALSGTYWVGGGQQDAVVLAVLPYFHVTGMQSGMNGPLATGATVVLVPRWDREVVARCVQRYGVTSMSLIAAMVVDFLANPKLADYDLSSLRRISGGGAAMPEAVARQLKERWGLQYIEGYGMSETIAATHVNPVERPKLQCLGIPLFDVEARVVDPADFRELAASEVGEILIHGPQLMQGYWNNPRATAEAFVELDGKRFLRTGDLARCDEEGYFFMVDRLKRMINASGFKVWPAEVETLLYQHPAIQEACVIGVCDAKRGETVKAIVVLRDAHRGRVTERDIIDWAHENMAAYKSPRIVEFADSLPRSGTGKIQWRELQERAAGG